MKLGQIRPLAEGFIMQQTMPFAARWEIAGSIRRGKPECRDIEIVCIPQYKIQIDMFGNETSKTNHVIWGLRRKLNIYGESAGFKFIKGNNDCPKYTQLEADHNGQPIKIDLFFATPENWGWIFFIRTGPKEWNIKAMQRLNERGYRSKDGYIQDDAIGDTVYTPDEMDIFSLLGWPWVKPRDRK